MKRKRKRPLLCLASWSSCMSWYFMNLQSCGFRFHLLLTNTKAAPCTVSLQCTQSSPNWDSLHWCNGIFLLICSGKRGSKSFFFIMWNDSFVSVQRIHSVLGESSRWLAHVHLLSSCYQPFFHSKVIYTRDPSCVSAANSRVSAVKRTTSLSWNPSLPHLENTATPNTQTITSTECQDVD